MALARSLYNALFKRTSTFALTVIVGGIFFERAYDSWVDSLWERMNRGVRQGGTRARVNNLEGERVELLLEVTSLQRFGSYFLVKCYGIPSVVCVDPWYSLLPIQTGWWGRALFDLHWREWPTDTI